MRENILHYISTGRREIRDNSFLRDLGARMLSSRRAMSRSMILRIRSKSSAEDEALVSSEERQLNFRLEYLRLTQPHLEPFFLLPKKRTRSLNQIKTIKVCLIRYEVCMERLLAERVLGTTPMGQ